MPKLVLEKGLSIDDAVTVKVGGFEFDGWKTVQLESYLNAISQSFQLEVLDRWRQTKDSWPLRPGNKVEVSVGETLLITGYIDKLDVNATGTSRQFQITGRTKTGDLVDCTPNLGQYEFNNLTLDRIASQFAKPFGISVSKKTDVGAAFSKLVLGPSDSAWEFLEKLCAFRGVLLVPTPEGNLEIIKPGSTRAKSDIVQGINMLSVSASFDNSQRFSEYTMLAQTYGTEENNGKNVSQVLGTVSDPGISRYRPLTLVVEAEGTNQSASTRALWEATSRNARSAKVTCSVQGWFRQDKSLWKINEIVRIEAPLAGIKSDFLIEGVIFKKDGGGTTTEIHGVRPDAYASRGSLDGSLDPVKKLGVDQ